MPLNMNLAPENVSFLGIGRRTVSKMLSFDLDKIKAFQPKVIILDLGTNNLCSEIYWYPSPVAPSSVVSQDMVSSITSAISSAVLESLKSAGIIPQEPVQTSDPAVAVQGSVAQVVQDLTGESHPLTSTSITSGPKTDHGRDKIHTLISVPLSSRVPDKIQSKIWANEYINLRTLLSSLPGDPKYNFTVKSSGSNLPVVSLEAVQNSKRITSIDPWTTAFQVFVAVYTIRFPDSAPGLMKYSATVRDLAAKNAHWHYYDENFRYLRQ